MEENYCGCNKYTNLAYRAATRVGKTVRRSFEKVTDGLAGLLIGRIIINTISEFSEAGEIED